MVDKPHVIYPWRAHSSHENHVAVSYGVITFYAFLHKKAETALDQLPITILVINHLLTLVSNHF